MTDAAFNVETYQPDNLIAAQGEDGRRVVIPSGSGDLKRGDVLGKIKHKVGLTGFVGAGNGVVDSIVPKKKVEIGNYIVKIIEASANGGKFTVVTPGGARLKDGEVGTLYETDQISFMVNDGSTDFEVGDEFTLVIEAHENAGKYIKSIAAAVDGSEVPDLILAFDTPNSSTEDQEQYAYHELKANKNALGYGAGHTAETVQAAFDEAGRSIYLKNAVL